VVTTIKIEGTGEERQIVEPTVEYAFDSGYQLECDVRVTEGLQGEGSFLTHVPVSNLFGGFHNYAMCTPRGRSNTGINDSVEKSDGDSVLIQFIDGDIDRPMITGYAPHKYSNNAPENIPKIQPPEDGLKFIVNGTTLNINHDGDFLVSTTAAKAKQLLDTSDGSIVNTHPDRDMLSPLGHPPGAIICQSNSNIILSASYKSKETNYGQIVIQSEQDTIIRSEMENVNAFTDDPAKAVILQGPHEGTRSSARLHDKIKITAGNDNDLFKWCARLSKTLEEVGSFIEASGMVLDPLTAAPRDLDLVYAGKLLQGLNKGLPMYAEGRIIEGSPYVQVAGIKTSQDDPDPDDVTACTETTDKDFASNVTDGSGEINSISDAFAEIDTLADNLSYAELNAPPAPPLPGLPLAYQFLTPGDSKKVKGVKIPLCQWLASNPDSLFPDDFVQYYQAIIGLTSPVDWAALYGTPLYAIAVVAANILVSGSYDSLFEYTSDASSLAGKPSSAAGGAYNQAIDECVDKKMEV
jgi:hypothetical protein